MQDTTLLKMLKRHEGLKNFPYKCPGGKLTIGYGRNLEDVGISDDEAETLLVHDTIEALKIFDSLFSASRHISKIRRYALTNMILNLGKEGFLTFHKMIYAILTITTEQDWHIVANEAKNSKWYKQVGVRGTDIVLMLRNG